jgi:hypothetical protein
MVSDCRHRQPNVDTLDSPDRRLSGLTNNTGTKDRTMIGTAVDDRTFTERPAPIHLGHYRTRPTNAAILVAIAAARKMPGGIGKAIANVSGTRQLTCRVFPDVEPDRDEQPRLEDVETPGQHDGPAPTVDYSGRPTTRQADRPYLIWWAMLHQPAKDMIAELQPHDRDDIRQDLAIKYWRQAVKQEAAGNRITNPVPFVAKAVSAWIGRNTGIAEVNPLTQQQREDAVDALDAQRKAAEESRLQALDAELAIVQARFHAATIAKLDAKKPESVFCFKW